MFVHAAQAAPWHCQHVEVTSTASGETWLFPCNAWLGSSSSSSSSGLAGANMQQPPCEPSRLLLPAPNLEALFRQLQEEQELQQRREQYKVSVYTSAQSPTHGEADAVGQFNLLLFVRVKHCFYTSGRCIE
jgi:hypothetical protein